MLNQDREVGKGELKAQCSFLHYGINSFKLILEGFKKKIQSS